MKVLQCILCTSDLSLKLHLKVCKTHANLLAQHLALEDRKQKGIRSNKENLHEHRWEKFSLYISNNMVHRAKEINTHHKYLSETLFYQKPQI